MTCQWMLGGDGQSIAIGSEQKDESLANPLVNKRLKRGLLREAPMHRNHVDGATVIRPFSVRETSNTRERVTALHARLRHR